MITKTQKAMIMSRARLWHRNRATITNAQLAIDIGLCDNRKQSVNFCHALGLYADGAKGHTNLNKMLEHIKTTEGK